jgi:hypothetical protein
MGSRLKRRIMVGTVAGLAVAGGGVAIGAAQLESPQAESQAVIDDAAEQLGVQPSALRDALKTALKNRLDGAVAAGRLSAEQADELKSRIDAGDFPLLGGFDHRGPHAHLGLDAAASYLGVTEAELRSELESGKTLADVGRDRDKSVDGLISAMTDALKARLHAAVEAGRVTRAQADEILADAEERLTDLVNGRAPTRPALRRFRPPFGHPEF